MSEAYVKTRNAIVFSLMMIFMAQVGYLSILNPWYETLDEEYVPAKSTALPSGLAFSAMTCGYEVMSDVQGDNGNNDALDIVGNASYPAVQTASNATSVFIQLRLDGTPTNSQGTSLQSFMWGMEFDTDGNKSTYEHLVSYYGSGSDSLKIYNNTVTTTADSPTDSADSVSVELTPASDYWNSSVADSSFGGDDDYLLTMILPWDVLEDHDMDRNGTPSFNWFGTSTSNQNLNGDFACHDGDNDGAPQLTTTASDPVPLDSARRFTFSGGVWSGSSTVYYVNGTQYDSLTFAPTSIPDGATFEVDPTLPSGLSVNASGVLSGIPTQIMSGGTYTMYANSTVDGVAFSATANIILNVAPGEVDFELWQSVVDGAKLPLNAAMDPITFGYVEGEDASAIYGNGSYWNITEAYSSSGFGNRISQLDGYDVMFDDDVIMFNDNNDLYMHNLNNGTTWKELTHSGGFYTFLYVIDDVLLFDSYVSSLVDQLWAYNTSNGTAWRVGGAGFELPTFTCCGTGWPVTGTKSFPPSPLKVGDDFYLYGEDTNGPGEGLYRFNGTSFELEFLSNSTTPSTSFSNLKNLIHHNGTVYFTAQEFGTYRWDLYKHTIATNQTSMLHDVTGGSTSSSTYGFDDQVKMVSDDIIVFRYTGLWAYNITSNTSYQVNSSLGLQVNLNEAVVVDNVVYFSARTYRELYAYNLSSNATWMVKDINTNFGDNGFISNDGPDILVRNGKLYFIGLSGAQDINDNYRIWVHDTQENTTYSIDNGYNNGRSASWFHGFTRDQLFYHFDSNYDSTLMYDISTNETSFALSNPGQYWAFVDDVFVYQKTSDNKMYAYSPEELSVVSFDAVAGASCSIYPSLPTGLSLNQGNCTVSGTPTSVTPMTNFTLTATISGTIYSSMFWLVTDYLPLSPSVSGLETNIGETIEPITFGVPTGAEAGDGGWDTPYNNNFRTLLTGDYHSCAVKAGGSVACWGENADGQIGTSSTSTDYLSPELVDLPPGSPAVAVPVYAADHSCALLANSSLYCWGENGYGQLGIGSTASSVVTPTHVPLPNGRTVASIHADHNHACVVLDDGSALCTGYNSDRQLGIGNTTTMREYTPVNVLPSGAKVVDMALSAYSTCALLENGDVMCWGRNSQSQLGQGDTTTYTTAKKAILPDGNIIAIEGTVRSVCALYENGSVACWGENSPKGERGVGSSASNTSIAGFTNPMPGNLSAKSLFAGDTTFCVILSNGSVACWGDADAAYSTTSSNVLEPTLIPWPHGSVRAVELSVGWYHACALLENGSMWCWGQGDRGQMGDGTTNSGPAFVDIGKIAGPPASLSTATCSVQPSLPAGLTLAQGTCTISGTPTALSTNQTYTVYANTSQGTLRGQVWIGVDEMLLFPSKEGAELLIGKAMANITFQYNASAASGSGSGMTNVTGALSCTVSPSLPSGLSIDSSTCTISGTPTVTTSRTTYTVTANISNETYQVDIWLKTSPFATLTSSVDGAALELGATMTPISLEYFLTNAANITMEEWVDYGNDSTWRVANIYASYLNSLPGQYMSIVVGDSIYFDATDGDGAELWAHNTSNHSTWQVADIRSGSGSSEPGGPMSIVVGDTIYFDAVDGSTGRELWAHNTSNHSTWQVANLDGGSSSSTPSQYMCNILVGDTIYFDASPGQGSELWAHDTSNNSTWQVTNIYSLGSSAPGAYMCILVGDTIYFDAVDGSTGKELWAHNTSNHSTWQVADIRSGSDPSTPGRYMSIVVGDTIYFDAFDGSTGRELWAHNTSNHSTWQVADIQSSSSSSTPGRYMSIVVGDTIYFDADDGNWTELWAHDTSNKSTWQVADIRTSWGDSNPGQHMSIVVGDTIYFDADDTSTGRELWAHDTSNHSTWQVANIASSSNNGNPGAMMSILVGDTIYFDAYDGSKGTELWAHDTSNHSTWRVTDISPGSRTTEPGRYMAALVGDTLYFSATHNTGSSSTTTGVELWAHQPGEIQVISLQSAIWETEPQLPDGMSLTSGSISGTPSVYASNQTYTVYVNQNNYSFTLDLWFTVDTDNPHTVVENVTIDPIGFHPPFWNGTTTWTVSPALPSGLSMDSATGEITGAVNGTLANTTFTVTATHNGSATETFTFNLESLADYDGDGLPNDLPPDYDTNDPPTSGLVADDDDDGDGLPDANETDTGTYVNESDTGTDPLDPDTDDDGVCDGPNAITGVCVAGPDTNLGPLVVTTPIVLVNNTAVAEIDPFYAPTGATYGLSPALPSSLQFDASNGSIWGTPDVVMGNTSYTMWANVSGGASMQWTFYLAVLDDFDGDGLPDVLPGDYNGSEDPIRSAPGLEEDLDDDADGLPDTNETDTGIYVNESDTGTDPLDPDTDDDGICDGPNAVPGVCIAGPDTNTGPPVISTPIVLVNNTAVTEIDPFFVVSGATYSLSPSLPTSLQFDASNGSIWGTPDMVMTNTSYTMWANLSNGVSAQWTFYLTVLDDFDGDGLPDVLPGDYNGSEDPIRSAPGLEEDLDDDGDGYNDSVETDTGMYLDENNTGTDPLDPDTDDDGICDGPNAIPGICAAGPDPAPFGPTATVVAVNNTAIPNVPPYYVGSGLSYQIMPSLPAGLSIDPATGVISGTPTETIGNTTFTVFANHTGGNSYSWDFTIEVLEDTDGDGDPDTLPIDYDGNEDSIRGPPGLTEDLDDDNDGLPDLNETDTGIWNGEGDTGTDPLNPDTDGDGFCDGPASEVYDRLGNLVCRGPDPDPHDPTDPLDTDGDMYPDDDPDGEGGLEADDDDDNDGYPDISEDACNSDSKNATSIPEDMDGDAICDGDDLDMDGDGIDNLNETGLPIGTDPDNPDTDGDGVCDGPESPVTSNCTAGPDAFPLDPSASKDTDGDGKPDDLVPGVNSTSDPALIEDLDDDDDGWDDLDEIACGTDSLNETDIPVDLNGDGLCDVLDDDWDDDGIPNANETNTSIYVNETDTGTDPWNPDTDGDGYCDGSIGVMNGSEVVCVAGPDPYPNDPTQPVDTDGDGLPDELPDDYDGELIEDTDDDGDGVEDVDDLYPLNPGADTDTDGDGRPDEVRQDVNTDPSLIEDLFDDDAEDDGWSDLDEIACGTDPQDDTDEPGDIDEDGICDALDTEDNRDDLDGDGWSNVDELLCGTDEDDDSSVPKDSDLDGICNAFDPPILVYTNPNATRQYNTSDMWILLNESIVLTPFLDGILADTWEINGTLPEGLNFTGQARSGDGSIFGTPTELMNMTTYFITASNSLTGESISFMLNLSVVEDTDLDGLPDNDPDGPDGIIEGDLDDDNDGWPDTVEEQCETDSSDQSDTPADLVDDNNQCLENYVGTGDPSDEPFGYGLCFLPLLLLLLLLLLVLLYREREVLVGPEPEFTDAEPKFQSGQGTQSDPFVLKSPKPIKHGESVVSKELITFTNMSPNIKFPISDLGNEANRTRFKMIDERGSEEGVFEAHGDEEGTSSIRIMFDDSFENTREGGTFQGLLKIGLNSVYVMWEVEVKPDKEYLKELKKQEKEAEKQRKKEEAEAKKKAEADAKAKAEADAKADEEAKAKADAEAKAEEEAAAALLVAKKEEEEAEKKAKKEAEAAEKNEKKEAEKEAKAKADAEAKAKKEAEAAEKKAKEEAEKEAKAKADAEAKAKAEEEAAALLIAKKQEEEAEKEAKAKADAEAKAKAEKEEAEKEAKAKAEADAKAKAAAAKPATKEAKKEEEIERVKERAKSIDFKVLGKATTSEVKEEVKKGAETLNVGDASSFEDQGEATISDDQGSMVISWQGKDGNTLTGVKGVTRVIKTKAVLIARNDLQAIKGVGPFIEEKLNALGIYTWRQVANMNAKLEEQVNQAIEFFPGRVKRDQWVAQAKILLGENVKLDEKALKQAEELARVEAKAESIDFA
ncbi:MAG: putative Ig domain-containing protein, partial [Candidatus Poseidoniales archaeon]